MLFGGKLLPGTIVNTGRTYGTLKNLYIYIFLLKILGPIYYPVIVVIRTKYSA